MKKSVLDFSRDALFTVLEKKKYEGIERKSKTRLTKVFETSSALYSD
ncbi:MAG: hypothetical protein ACPGUE_09745 [Marinomonas sp.]|nr:MULTISPECIES: hypothetical protein [unclassified Marinomonas]